MPKLLIFSRTIITFKELQKNTYFKSAYGWKYEMFSKGKQNWFFSVNLTERMFIHATNSIFVFLFLCIQRLEMKDALSCFLDFQTTDQFRVLYSKVRIKCFAALRVMLFSHRLSFHLFLSNYSSWVLFWDMEK